MPKFSKSTYNVLMKTLKNSLTFDVSDPAKFRLHALNHYYLYGLRSTLDAFGIKKSTFYGWKKPYEKSSKRLFSLVPKSTRPKQTRTMLVDWRLEAFIRAMREQYGHLSKYKIRLFLDEYAKTLGITSYGCTKIGKIIKARHFFFDKGTKTKAKRKKVSYPRIKSCPKQTTPGYIEVDSITVFLLGKKYYFVSFIDVYTKYAWCKLVGSLSSLNTKQALIEFQGRLSYPIRTIQTDNGSEFFDWFHAYLEEQSIPHNFIYYHTPKINGIVERFNRTVQDEFINRNDHLGIDKDKFNLELIEYLNWYNTKRPHHSLGLVSPLTFINNLKNGD